MPYVLEKNSKNIAPGPTRAKIRNTTTSEIYTGLILVFQSRYKTIHVVRLNYQIRCCGLLLTSCQKRALYVCVNLYKCQQGCYRDIRLKHKQKQFNELG